MKSSILTVFMYFIVTTNCREFRDYYSSASYENYDDDDVSNKPHYDLKDAPQLFEKFIKDFGKVYSNEEDKRKHYEIFKTNVEGINKLNVGPPGETATFDINMFTDMEIEKDAPGWGDEEPALTAGTKGAEGADRQGPQWTQQKEKNH